MNFDKPTLITITGPTCSGKSYLLEKLIERGCCARVISTTTRAPRSNEKDGVNYFFIDEGKSRQLEKDDELAELVTFHGVRYGVTKAELQEKLAGDKAAAVVVEPSGVTTYERYCATNGWGSLKVFVFTPEAVRVERLVQRTETNIRQEHVKFNSFVEFMQVVKSNLRTHTERLLSLTGEERTWFSSNKWDVIVSGEDVDKAIADIEQAVKWRSYQNDQLNT